MERNRFTSSEGKDRNAKVRLDSRQDLSRKLGRSVTFNAAHIIPQMIDNSSLNYWCAENLRACQLYQNLID